MAGAAGNPPVTAHSTAPDTSTGVGGCEDCDWDGDTRCGCSGVGAGVGNSGG